MIDKGAGETGMRQRQNADDAGAGHDRGDGKIEPAAEQREQLADHDDLERRELAGQVLCIGDRQKCGSRRPVATPMATTRSGRPKRAIAR